jgi:hypothetical protein
MKTFNNGPLDVDAIIALLNSALAADRAAVSALVEQRVPCNEALRDHPTIQVAVNDGQSYVGLLGMFNGLFQPDERGYGPIAVEYDEGGVLRFLRTAPANQRSA